MGLHVLENEVLKVSVLDAGAELASVYDKENGQERIWNADPSVWNRHAPILFPFVGKLNGGVYRIGDREYAMKTQHGFARDMEFECVGVTVDSVTHRLAATEDTLEKYPYSFELFVTHALDSENPRLLHVNWEVKNQGDTYMYYSIGGHPGFWITEGKKQDYYIVFPGRDDLTYIAASPVSGLAVADKEYKLETKEGYILYNDTLPDTWIFDYQNIKTVGIADQDKRPFVTMNCEEFSMLGVWSNPNGPFICLEPWVGRADNEGFTGSLKEKAGMEGLEPGTSRKLSHSIEFHRTIGRD